MTEVSLALRLELYKLTGWDYPLRAGPSPEIDRALYAPDYSLGFIIAKILSGHQIKFRYHEGKVIASAPQLYRFMARTAEDAACMMLIALVKNGVIK